MHLKSFIFLTLVIGFFSSAFAEMPYLKGKWLINSEENPLDDSKTISAALIANVGENSQGQKPTLIIRCKSNETELFVNWDDYLGLNSINVLTRIGKAKAVKRSWDISTDNKASFFPSSPISFIKEMIKSDQLVMQITPYSENPITAIFDTKGLSEVIKPIEKTCNWPISDTKKPSASPIKIDDVEDISFSEMDAIRGQFVKCWRVPAGIKNDYDLKVHVSTQLRPDGSVIDAQISISDTARYNNDTFFRSAADSAIRAIYKCSPLKNMPADKYSKWKNLELTFDPKDLLY